jgi:sugar lactone lactonase YvrE
MGDPRGVYADNSGRLWVADAFNNRVLRFDNAAALTGSPGFLPPPSVVFGQPNFSSGTAGTDRNTFSNPCGVWLDASGRLYVADSFNSRVMIFNNAPSLGNGPPASNVLGQPNFTTSTANTTQDGLRGPRRVSYDESTSSLYVADLSNNRVTRFTPSTFTAAGVSVSGRIVDRYGYGIRGARITFTDERGGDRVAVTNAFGYYTLSDLAAGQAYLARVSSKGLVFPSRLIQVNDSIAGADFSAQ